MFYFQQHHKPATSTTEESPVSNSVRSNTRRTDKNQHHKKDISLPVNNQTNSMNSDETTEPLWKVVSKNDEMFSKENFEEKVVVLTCQERVWKSNSTDSGKATISGETAKDPTNKDGGTDDQATKKHCAMMNFVLKASEMLPNDKNLYRYFTTSRMTDSPLIWCAGSCRVSLINTTSVLMRTGTT